MLGLDGGSYVVVGRFAGPTDHPTATPRGHPATAPRGIPFLADMPAPPAARRTRQCSRPGCSEPAAATLTYRYDLSAVWIDDLTPEREPHGYDLCERHAARCSVPHGWCLEDRRTPIAAWDRLAG